MNKRKLNGYTLVYCPAHPNSMTSKNWKGYIYEHRLVASKMLGRPLKEYEIVHHIDEDCSNNHPSNLEVMTRSEHSNHHNIRLRHSKECKSCGEVHYNISYCSPKCAHEGRKKVKNRPSRDALLELLETNSVLSVGKMFGVSDSAIRKWLRK